jgi:hypothetical protein
MSGLTFLWLSGSIVAALLCNKLVIRSRLREAGRPLDGTELRNRFQITDYIAVCRERCISPWPAVVFLALCGVSAIGAGVVGLVTTARR